MGKDASVINCMYLIEPKRQQLQGGVNYANDECECRRSAGAIGRDDVQCAGIVALVAAWNECGRSGSQVPRAGSSDPDTEAQGAGLCARPWPSWDRAHRIDRRGAGGRLKAAAWADDAADNPPRCSTSPSAKFSGRGRDRSRVRVRTLDASRATRASTCGAVERTKWRQRRQSARCGKVLSGAG